MSERHDPHGRRLPVKLDATTNGEFAPVPLAPVHHQANRLAHEAATVNARRLGLGRRGFLVSACGVASSLIAMNAAYARAGRSGGWYDLPDDAALDLEVAQASVDGERVHLRHPGPFREPERRLDATTARRRAPAAELYSGPALRAAPRTGPVRLPALRRPRSVRQGRLP